MIGVKLMGGIGNMMFQVAFAEYNAHKYGKKLCYPNLYEQFIHLYKVYPWEDHCFEYFTIFENLDWFKNQDDKHPMQVQRVGFPYEEIIPQDGICYDGYFQSAKYFDDAFDFVRTLFRPTWQVIEKSQEELDLIERWESVCSIHVRRGNYLQLKDHHIVLGMDYYNRAMEIIKADKYLIFSDDLGWCMENFKGDQFIFLDSRDYVALYAMSRCDHSIVANSSLSWWGAYLAGVRNRTIVAPSQWFPNNNPDSRDMVPKEWIKI